MEYSVYGLFSTQDGEIKYVGQTKNKLKKRLYEHIYESLKRGKKNHKCNWIRQTYKNGFSIDISLLETTNEKNVSDSEKKWIKVYGKVNQLEGGNSGGIGGKVRDYLDYNSAKKLIIGLKKKFNINSQSTYFLFIDKHKNTYKFLPKHPDDVYKLRGEWINWGDYLSTNYISDNIKHLNYMPYNELKELLSKNNIRTIAGYKEFRKSNLDKLPLNPHKSYKNNGWISYGEFFNRKKICKCDFYVFCRYMSMYHKDVLTISKLRKKIKEGKISKKIPYHPEIKYKMKWCDIVSHIIMLTK